MDERCHVFPLFPPGVAAGGLRFFCLSTVACGLCPSTGRNQHARALDTPVLLLHPNEVDTKLHQKEMSGTTARRPLGLEKEDDVSFVFSGITM